MVGSSWSSSSSCTSSFGSIHEDDVICVVKPDVVAASGEGCIKFLCGYGGRILPRHTDGALRYVGGHNRVLSVDRSIHFYELQRKLREMCGSDVSLLCQLPTEDLDALVSVTSDDDLANLLEEYDAASKDRLQPLKIRAFLFPRSPVPPSSPPSTKLSAYRPAPSVQHLHRQNSAPVSTVSRISPTSASRWWTARQASRSVRPATILHQTQPRLHGYLVHNGSHRQ